MKNLQIVKRKTKGFENALIENSEYTSSNHLKNKLFDNGLKNRKCEMCGQDENWNGKKMSLILDHINGINNDNRLENLRIVCPNCNATLETHCRGNKKYNKRNKRNKKCNGLDCNNLIMERNNYCMKCYQLSRNIKNISKDKDKEIKVGRKNRKVERPNYEELIENIKLVGWKKTGEKYKVSDNAVRKWVKLYIKYENKENVLNINI